jgi:hypothetical protein
MANVKFYSGGGSRPLGGQIDEIPYITAKPGQLNTIASTRYRFAAKMVEALMDKREADMKRDDRAQYMAAATTKGFDPSKMAPMEEESPYVAAQRDSMAQALQGRQPSPLGDMAEADDVSRFFQPSETGGTEALFGADPTNNPAMQAALIGDVGTRAEDEAAYLAKQKAAHIGPREAMRNLTPQTEYGENLQYEYELGEMERDRALQVAEEERQREAALLAEASKEARILKGIGTTPVPKVSVKKVADPLSRTGWSYKNVLDPTSEFLGEAESEAPRFDPLASSKEKVQTLSNERYKVATKGREEVEEMLGKIEQMRGLAQRVDSGPLTDFKTDFMSLGNSLGMGFDVENIANVEAMRAKGMDFILDIIAGTKGAISEREMAAFEKASPGVGNSKLGNKQILDLAEASAQRLKVAHEAVRTAYKADGASVVDLDDAFFKSQEEWGGFGFIFPPKDLPPELQDGWSGLTWDKKKKYYKLKGIKY